MTNPTCETSTAPFVRRHPIRLMMLIGGIMLPCGGRSPAGEPPTKKESPRSDVVKRAAPSVPAGVAIPPYNSFSPRSSASDEDREFQKKVAEVLKRQCKSYPGRMAHFSWLAEHRIFQLAAYRMDGWGGVVMEAKESPDGGWIAKVRVKPCVAARGRSYIKDYIEETYRYHNGVLTLIETDADVPKPDMHQFILH